MGYWNYRVGRTRRQRHHDLKEYFMYHIYEAYYNDDDGLAFVSSNPIQIEGSHFPDNEEIEETEDEAVDLMMDDLELMRQAFYRPILDMDNLEFATPDGPNDTSYMGDEDEGNI